MDTAPGTAPTTVMGPVPAPAGMTMVIATHEIGRALALCDRALALRGGRVVFDGPTSEYEGAIAGATEAVGLGAKS